jgi:glycosyltransferase involved in cell wall biosynthesis
MYIYHKGGKIYVVSNTPLDVGGEELKRCCLGYSQKDILQNFVVKAGRLVKKNRKIRPQEAKIAFIGVWGIPCGIATYSKFLVDEMKNISPHIKVFAEEYEGAENSDELIHCWRRGQSPRRLIREIRKYDPDIVFIQHEYGIFPDARKWTQLISALEDYQTYVALHSVYNHKDKVVCEAICKNLIVHSEAAKKVLIEKGISTNIRVIPHGCVEFENTHRLWNIYRSPHTLIQFGFGFEYKGWEVALDAVKLLKEKYPDVFYVILFSESGFVKEQYKLQYDRIRQLIQDLDLEDNVALIRGFQSDEALNYFLRTARVAIFPYTANPEHIVYGSSGAARIAMGNGTPVVVSKVPLFYDLDGVVPRAGNAEELAEEIAKLFDDWKYYRRVVERGMKFVHENNWRVTAKRYLGLDG